MKVVFITREGRELAGARVRCYNFARALAGHGIEAKVFSFGDHLGARYGENELGMSFFEKLKLNGKALGVLAEEGRDTVFILQRVNYHVLAPLWAAFAKKNRFVLDCDDWNIRENPVYHFGFYPSSGMEYVTRKVAGRAAACVAASAFLRDYLQPFNANVTYIPTGVDTELFSPGERRPEGRVVFSWVGTAYHPEMGDNIRFLIACFSRLAERHGQVVLSLAGQGKYFEEVKKEIYAHRFKDRIEVHAWISPDDVPSFLSGSDVGLLPLIQDTKFNKGKSPTKLFEYMSMARPVIASPVGEAGSIVRHGVTGLLAGDRDAFVACMQRLVESPSLRGDMGRTARMDVEGRY